MSACLCVCVCVCGGGGGLWWENGEMAAVITKRQIINQFPFDFKRKNTLKTRRRNSGGTNEQQARGSGREILKESVRHSDTKSMKMCQQSNYFQTKFPQNPAANARDPTFPQSMGDKFTSDADSVEKFSPRGRKLLLRNSSKFGGIRAKNVTCIIHNVGIIDRYSRYVFPLAYIFLNLIYWYYYKWLSF